MVGTLHISRLARSQGSAHIPPLVEVDGPLPEGAERIQLLEGTEYVYSLEVPQDGSLTTDPPELFSPDTVEGRRGRLKTGLSTGTVPAAVFRGGLEIGRCAFEVRSRKLDYEEHYRWMMRDIAGEMTDLVMERFAPSLQQFQIDDARDAETLYQRFAFLKGLLLGEELQASLAQVVRRPYVAWQEFSEERPIGRARRPSAALAQQIARGGRRVPWTVENALLGSLPAIIEVGRTDVQVDNPPNQFVKFALKHWRHLVALVGDALENSAQSPAVIRGRREVTEVAAHLDELLSNAMFRDVGQLSTFPVGNQVLQKRVGYREIYRAFIEFELAAQLTWQGGEDVYGAGQRNVATLYEYWTFLELAKVVGRLCDVPLDSSQLVQRTQDGLGVSLRSGRHVQLQGHITRYGRPIAVELHFNRTFRGTTNDESWTVEMRPDCSLHLTPKGVAGSTEDVWLHFDAKYRIDRLVDLLGEDSVSDEGGASGALRRPLREDLLKMHAYRDAIERSNGAYIMYPGDEERRYLAYHEILPGLGAFPLVPVSTGESHGSDALATFLDDVIGHLARQSSQDERTRFWMHQIHRKEPVPAHPRWAPFLDAPPGDTPVLLGFVKSDAHYAWIRQQGRYNIRASGPRGRIGLSGEELGARLVVLYREFTAPEIWEVTGEPELVLREKMLRLGYPDPRTEAYFCLPVGPMGDQAEAWTSALGDLNVVRQALASDALPGAPVACTWQQLLESIA